MKVSFSSLQVPATGSVAILAAEGGKLSAGAKAVDDKLGGAITRAMKAADFKGEKDKMLDLISPADGKLDRVIVMGMGKPSDLTAPVMEYAGGALAGKALAAGVSGLSVVAELPGKLGLDANDAGARLVSGMRLRLYKFDKYKTKKKDAKAAPASVRVLCEHPAKVRKLYGEFDAIAAGVHIARDLVNEPANHLTPKNFASEIKKLSKLGLKVQVLDEKQMEKEKMGALLGVAQGSVNKPYMAIMRWDGGKKDEAPVAFVGKGVTFDTGGISIKPAGGMEDMKGDMGGAACVTGLMAALAGRKAKVNAVGVVGLVENMPDGNAQRPGDVVKSMSGQTIAVLNTDAEGRLVLADALWYTQQKFKPKFMINLATLTGAILIALGKEHAGLFSNDDKLSMQLAEAGAATLEKVWRLPLTPEYDKLIDSDIADMKNIGGRLAGSITAGQFLQRFVNGVPWAHLDVAGTAMDSPKSAINQSWGSGWGVRLLDALVRKNYEK